MNVVRFVSIPGAVSLYAACFGKPFAFVNLVFSHNNEYK
jgi:hypothetical protein